VGEGQLSLLRALDKTHFSHLTFYLERKPFWRLFILDSKNQALHEYGFSLSNMSTPQDALAKSVAETKVQYRRLGSSGLRVSVPILGAMSLGDKRCLDWAIEEEEALPLLKAAYDRGNQT
jgi:hypothetical protein